MLPACVGSPVSFVPPTFVPVTLPFVLERICADAKLSLAGPLGAPASVQEREMFPFAGVPLDVFHPSTATMYVAPAVAVKPTWLVPTPLVTSSFAATSVRAETLEPR